MKCPRRSESPVPAFMAGEEDGFSSKDGTCTYCGSMNEVEFMVRARDGVDELIPTDKDYKVYVQEVGPNPAYPQQRKFYFQHLDEAQQREFVDLLNARKLKIGHPGHFYTRPFFVVVGTR